MVLWNVGSAKSSLVSRARLATVVTVSAALVGGIPSMVSAAGDLTPPTLSLPANASFVVGTAIGPMAPDPDTGTPLATDGITMRARWSASDASGICGYSLQSVFADPAEPTWSAWSAQTSVTATTTDYDSQAGGGAGKWMGYNVRARDCAGNITQKFVAFRPAVYQEDGRSYGYGTLGTSYSGAWAVTTCVCWSGGTARKTIQYGARAQFLLDYTERRHPIGLVMEKAPGRGRAQVKLDGVVVATVDTYAATATHRSVVWTGSVTSGPHTLTVVNLATTGRARIDVDAVLVSGLSA